MTRRRRILVILAAVPLLVALALCWLLGTTAGLRFVLARAEHATGGALGVGKAQGRLAGTLTLDGLRYHATGGPDVHAERVTLRIGAWALLRARVHVEQLRVLKLDVALPMQPAAAAPSSAPFDPRAPVHMAFEGVAVDGLRVHRGTQDLFVAERVDLAGAWTRDGVELNPLRVRAPAGSLDLDARVAFMAGHPGNARGRFDWRAGGRRWSGQLQARSNGRSASASLTLTRPSSAHADLTLATRAPFAWTAKVSLPRGAASAWLGPGGSIKQLAAVLDAHGDTRQLHASGSFDIDATRLQLAALDARLGTGGKHVQIDRLQLRSPQHPGTLQASGRIDLSGRVASANMRVAWNGVKIPARLAGRAWSSDGTLDFDGSPDRYHATLEARAGAPGKTMGVHAQVLGTPGQLQIDSLDVQQAKGRLHAHGQLHYAGGVQWQLAATASDFDPAPLLPGWPGALDAQLSSHGELGKDSSAQLGIASLAGTLRGHRVDGHGTLAWSKRRVLSGRLDLRYGSGQVALSGASGARNDLDIRLDIGALGDWLDGASGGAKARLRLRGNWPGLALDGSLDGTQLDWRGQRAATLSARFDLPDVRQPGGSLHLAATDLHAGGFAFGKLQLDAQGNARAHRLDLDASGDPLSLNLALDGGLQKTSWNGHLTRLDLKLTGRPDWRLVAPVALSWDRGKASLGRACLSAGTPQLCLDAGRSRDGALHAHYRMRQLPLELPLALAANDLPMRATGTLDGEGDIQRSAAGVLSGKARIQSAKGAVSYLDHPQQPLLDYRNLDARLDLAKSLQQLQVSAALQRNGSLDGSLTVQGPGHALNGQLRMRLDNLRFVELFTTEVANLEGRFDAGLTLAGTLAKPTVDGTASVEGLSGELPALGLKLKQGQLRLSGNQASGLRIDGRVHSGKGMLEITGTAGLGAGQTTRLTLRGKQVQVADIPSATVSLSPDLRVEGNAKGLRIDGKVSVDTASVNLDKLPGAGATQASPDVVVVDAGKPAAAKPAALPVNTDVSVQLGDHAHVTGYGLDGNLHGGLRVLTRPGKQALGQGQIRIDGTFRAYGQDLSITRGRLLFASSPLDNPGLDIRAVRKLNPNATIDDGQEVGLEVRGTARRPELTVFSNPMMEQSDALSYLITGKPLSQVKGGEGSMVDSAAQALGSATGDLLAKSVGSRLGISDIGVSSNQALGTTAFTVGKYLSPRLYLSYGVGLFQPGQVVTLRYILSRRWNFEAQQSTESSRASLNYRYEH